MSIDERRDDIPGLRPGNGYSHVVSTGPGRLAFVSGQIALDESGALVGDGDLAAQTRQALRNLEAVLTGLGATWSDLVKFTWFVLDASQAQVIRDVRDEFLGPVLGDTPNPASSLVQVSALVLPELLIEVEAVVALD